MASSIQCPACRVRIAVRPGLTACPGCGARLKKKAPSAASDDDETGPPRKKKQKKKAKSGPNYAMLAAAGGGFVILAAIAVMVAIVLDRPKRKDDPAGPAQTNTIPGQPGGPVDAGPTWLAKADPPKAAIRPKDELAIPISGRPLFASGQAPFVADMVTAGVGPDAPPMTVYDLRTGQSALTAKAIHQSQASHGSGPALEPLAALGPDGKSVAIRTITDSGTGKKRTTTTEAIVYRLGMDGAPIKIAIPNWVPWMEFGRDEDQLLVVSAPPAPMGGLVAMAFDLKQPTQPAMNLDVPRMPLRWREGFRTPESLAVSPGRNFMAVGGERYVDLIQLSDGKLAGRCELPGDCISVAFSSDGQELTAHSTIPPPRRSQMPPQYQWTIYSMADGKQKSVNQVGGGKSPGLLLASGPKPGLAIHGNSERVTVTDTRYGAPVYTMAFHAVSAFDTDRLLGIDTAARQVVVRKLDIEQVAAGAAEVTRLFGPRPAPVAGDRAGLAVPVAPTGWAVPVDAGSMQTPALVDRFTIANGAEFVMPWPGGSVLSALTIHRIDTPRERYALKWQAVDLTMGKADDAIDLWPSVLPAGQVPTGAGFGAYVADHTADGSKIAVRDAATPARVDVWDRSGKRLLGFLPYGPDVQVDSVTWISENRLLTRGGDKTTAWDVAGPKAVFEFSGYVGTHVLSPGRKWIGLQSDKHIDVYETATGKPLGRLEHSNPSKKPWQGFAVSRDGLQLAALELERTGFNNVPAVWSMGTWDLTTGQRRDLRRMYGMAVNQSAQPAWLSPRQLLAGGSDVIDLDALAVTATVSFQAPNPLPSPDGRFWGARADRTGANPNTRMPMETILATKPEEALRGVPKLAAADIVFRDGTTVEAISETGDNGRDAVGRSILSQQLTSEGYVTGKGGWQLKLSGQRTAGSGATLETPKGEKIRVPGVSGKKQLIDPAGTVVWEGSASGGWDMNRSKYKTGKEDLGPLGGSITHFNFGLRDPVEAMADEAWDNFMEGLKASNNFPRVMARVNGKVVPIPVAVAPK